MLEIYALNIRDLEKKINPTIFNGLLEHATPWKRPELLGLKREELKSRGLFSDLVARYVLMKRTEMANKEIDFVKNRFGKPFLEGRPDVQFNVSHSGIWIVFAVDDLQVGVDVEQVQPIDFSICEHYFSKDEYADLIAKSDREGYFFALWTLKESFLKILGEGLWRPLNTFSIKYFTPTQIAIWAGGRPVPGIYFRPYDIHKEYKVALCAAHQQFPPYVKTITIEDIISHFLG